MIYAQKLPYYYYFYNAINEELHHNSHGIAIC